MLIQSNSGCKGNQSSRVAVSVRKITLSFGTSHTTAMQTCLGSLGFRNTLATLWIWISVDRGLFQQVNSYSFAI